MEIITALQNGDEFVFRQVFDEYHAKVYAKIFSSTRSAYIAEEVVQLTFIKLWEYRGGLSEDYTISAQVFRIASTTLIDLLRRQKAAKRVATEKQPHLTEDTQNSTLHILDQKDVHKKIHEALRTLPSVRRQAFEMCRLNGMSYKEVASELSISEKAVENHIYKATRQLRQNFFAENAFLPATLNFF